jgi:hypothetical protein
LKHQANGSEKKTAVFVDGHVNPLGWVDEQSIPKEAGGVSSPSVQLRLESIDNVIDAIKKVPEGN